jgi:hypothetical protein
VPLAMLYVQLVSKSEATLQVMTYSRLRIEWLGRCYLPVLFTDRAYSAACSRVDS